MCVEVLRELFYLFYCICFIRKLCRYEVAGQRNEAVCVQGSWIVATSMRCAPVDCRRPKIPLATVACSDGTTYDSECIFKCDKPARLVGRFDM